MAKVKNAPILASDGRDALLLGADRVVFMTFVGRPVTEALAGSDLHSV